MLKNKFVLYTTLSILFILFIIPILMVFLIKMAPANDQPGYGHDGRVSIYGNREFKQTFISKENNLTAIATTIKNPHLKNKYDIFLNLFDENDNMIRSTKVNGFNIGDGDFVKIPFDPIPSSSGKKYSFLLSSPNANEKEIIELFLIKPTNEVLEYSYDGNIHPGGIPMVTFHKTNGLLDSIKKVYINLFSKSRPQSSQRI